MYGISLALSRARVGLLQLLQRGQVYTRPLQADICLHTYLEALPEDDMLLKNTVCASLRSGDVSRFATPVARPAHENNTYARCA